MVSEDDYHALCEYYPFFKRIGFNGFAPKLWLIFKALEDGKVDIDGIARNPCQSLMENKVSLSEIENYFKELWESAIFTKSVSGEYNLNANDAYALRNICYEITRKIPKDQSHIESLIIKSGYVLDKENQNIAKELLVGDVNDQTIAFVKLMTQLAFAGARLLIRIIVSGSVALSGAIHEI